jgi:predicted DNA-binding transcriptional regulator YafY
VVSSDAAGWLTVNLSVDNAELAKMMVFGLGQQAEIIAPDDLHDAVLAGARQILDITGGL